MVAYKTSLLRQTHGILLCLNSSGRHANCIEDQCIHDNLVYNLYRHQTSVRAHILMPSLRGTLVKSSKIALKRSSDTINSLMIRSLREG